jgi:3-methyladenine DNA glycosylase AlkD
MTKAEILQILEEKKDERGMRHWEKAGIKGMSSFGIGMTKLKTIAKKAGKNHELAIELWKEPNFECKTLSTLIDDPKIISREQINKQVYDVHFWMLSHAFCNYLLPKYSKIQELAEEWKTSKNDLERRCAFQLFYQISKNDKKLPDAYFFPIINQIENDLQKEENFVKDAMNSALWGIGMRSKNLNKMCLEVARKIGKVEVDYGDNSCEAINVTKHLTSEQLQKKLNQ